MIEPTELASGEARQDLRRRNTEDGQRHIAPPGPISGPWSGKSHRAGGLAPLDPFNGPTSDAPKDEPMPRNSPFSSDDVPIADTGQEASALPASTEAWIERMMRGAERMHRDENYRREIAQRLS